MLISLTGLTSGLWGQSGVSGPLLRVRSDSGKNLSSSADSQPGGAQPGSSQMNDPVATALGHVRSQVDQQLGIAQVGSGQSAGASGYSSKDVASHVLDFVSRRLQQEAAHGANAAQLQKTLDEARQGVAEGFKQAQQALQASGKLSGDLSQSIGDSLSQINQGLDQLAKQYQGSQGNAASGNAPTTLASSRGASLQYASNQSLALNIQTAQGDQVQIRLSERQYQGYSASQQGSGSNSQSQLTQTHLFSGRYQISVKGNLNTQEQQAISDLVSHVQAVANQFFSGDTQDAFQQASNLNLDGTQLAQFSLNLNSVQSVRAAAYSSNASSSDTAGGNSSGANTSQGSAPSSGGPSIPVAKALQPAGSLAGAINQVAGQARSLGIDPQVLHQLFSHVLGSTQGTGSASPAKQAGTSFDQFLKALLGATQAQQVSHAGNGHSRDGQSQDGHVQAGPQPAGQMTSSVLP